MTMHDRFRPQAAAALVLVLTVTLGLPAAADDAQRRAMTPQELVDAAMTSFDRFMIDPEMEWFRTSLRSAEGILIMPRFYKLGFIVGGSGGNGVLLARDGASGGWSSPSFYTMGSATFGLQAGVQWAETIILVMTDRGMDALLSNKFQLGADASIAAGPVGAGVQAATTDMLQFTRGRGAFGGLTVEGAMVAVRSHMNQEYYGKEVRPVDILVQRSVSRPEADRLRAAIRRAAHAG